MAYLGCVTDNNDFNEVGMAVSERLEGSWVKTDEINPIANFYESDDFAGYDTWRWGYGQPCVISADEAGKVLLFYSVGAARTYTRAEYWDLLDLDNPQKLKSTEILHTGVTNLSGGSDIINNADFAWDKKTNRLYVITEVHPYDSSAAPTFISSAQQVLYVDCGHGDYPAQKVLESGDYSWTRAGVIGQAETGSPRNHNAGIITDEYGYVINPSEIPVLYTVSRLGEGWTSLGSYRIRGYLLKL
jgi:hypothetical protein